MLSRLMKSLLVVTLFFALHLSGPGQVRAYTGKQDSNKASVKQNTRHDQLIAETGTEINAPLLQVTVHPAAFFSAIELGAPYTLARLNISQASNVPPSRFYRLILFPFHGFW
ncbi:hypothetical protein [Mucilaginibacter ginsenosidivorax]|uniref:Uncharacterized protein n=1 Tax=Mucilaginibacter ginsenosidivorax TaxID=862126 RepID=A0A5B8VT65_9SPHI|nr:hypothetical protein [Mucilaginibacter ginsenosidivorax]QEC74844.1 hypothetical protein FSB76_02380 [Mucilaginibacter ginsenosidivorax]